MRPLLLCATLLAASLLLAQAASAATVSRLGKTTSLSITADPGSAANDIDLDFCDQGSCAGQVRIRDRGDTLTVDPLTAACIRGRDRGPGRRRRRAR